MSFRKETYNIRNTKVIINVLKNLEIFEDSKVRESILDFHQTEDFCLKFSKIEYFFTDTDRDGAISGSLMWVNTEEIELGMYNVYISSTKDIIKYPIKTLKRILLHELTHIWYFRTFETSQSIVNAATRISNWKFLAEENTTNVYDIRSKLTTTFSISLLMEGIAEYVSRLKYEDAKLDKKTYKKLYTRASWRSDYIKISLNGYVNKDKLITRIDNFFTDKLLHLFKIKSNYISRLNDSLKDGAYEIGHHMVQAILYIDKTLTIEDVCNMNHLAFIKKYEACMNLVGDRPVISLTSGKGILDYKNMVDIIYYTYQKIIEEEKHKEK